MKEVYNDVLESIAKTPRVRLNQLRQGLKATVVAKLESRNPVCEAN
jgi:cysteine synthase